MVYLFVCSYFSEFYFAFILLLLFDIKARLESSRDDAAEGCVFLKMQANIGKKVFVYITKSHHLFAQSETMRSGIMPAQPARIQ